MKTKKVNFIIEVEPETIAEISENQSEEIQGGRGLSCRIHTCKPKDVEKQDN